MGWHRQNNSFGDLFGSIEWGGFERSFLAVSWWDYGYETIVWVILASTQPWWCRNFSSNE